MRRNASDAELFDAAYDAAKDVPDSRGYDWVLEATSAVLAAHGIDMDAMALSRMYHDPIVSYASETPRPTLDMIAQAMNGFWSNVPRHEPVYEYRPRATYLLTEWRRDTGYVESEMQRHIKEQKARRGSKRYRELLARMKTKAIDAVADDFRRVIDERNRRVDEEIAQSREEAIKLEEALRRTNEMIEIATTIIQASGRDMPSAQAQEGMHLAVENRRSKLRDVAQHVEYIEGVKTEDDPRAEAEQWWNDKYESLLTANEGDAEYDDNYEDNARSLELAVGEVDERASASLARAQLRAKYQPGDLSGAVLSAGYYAKKLGHTMYVYEGTSYMHIVYRVSDRASEYLNPINNSGSMVVSVTPDQVVSKHDVVR